jgi:dihydrolipoamide dehydrogenase
VGAVVDRERGVVVGAWAVGPEAGEWIHTAALAIKAEIPLAVLQDFVPQFPTFNELWGALWRSL